MERSGFQEAGANDQGMIFFLPNMTWGQPPWYARKMIADTWQPLAVQVASGGDGSEYWHSWLRQPPGGFTHEDGYLGGGGDFLPPTSTTVAGCQARCTAGCGGYCFEASLKPQPNETVNCYTKVCNASAGLRCGFVFQPHIGIINGRVAAQTSADGTRAVIRYVNQAKAAETVDFQVVGMAIDSATADVHTYHSDTLTAVNTPAHPRGVIPSSASMPAVKALTAVTIPGQSFTIIALTAGN
jgi:hypothetical protein